MQRAECSKGPNHIEGLGADSTGDHQPESADRAERVGEVDGEVPRSSGADGNEVQVLSG